MHARGKNHGLGQPLRSPNSFSGPTMTHCVTLGKHYSSGLLTLRLCLPGQRKMSQSHFLSPQERRRIHDHSLGKNPDHRLSFSGLNANGIIPKCNQQVPDLACREETIYDKD